MFCTLTVNSGFHVLFHSFIPSSNYHVENQSKRNALSSLALMVLGTIMKDLIGLLRTGTAPFKYSAFGPGSF